MTDPFKWTIQDLLAATGGSVWNQGGFVSSTRVGIDSRNTPEGSIFVAIKGENHDGHGYIKNAVEAGAMAVIAARDKADGLPRNALTGGNISVVLVDDPIAALGKMGRFNRRRSRASVVAVTGSNGKTTTRTLAASVLGTCFEVLQPEKNFNNAIGLPLTLLQLSPDHGWAVLELGMNHPGEIRKLGGFCEPDMGLITNVAPAHLEGVGTLEKVALAKAELLDTVSSTGTIVLNADDRRVRNMKSARTDNLILYGISDEASIRAEGIYRKKDGICFTLLIGSEKAHISIAGLGSFMVSNALAAAAIGHAAGLDIMSIKKGLQGFSPVKGRMTPRDTALGITVIDDTYNANPGSMRGAVASLTELFCSGRRILVVGDMLELGEASQNLHWETGKSIGEHSIDFLYTHGPLSLHLVKGAKASGMPANRIFHGEKGWILRELKKRLLPGDLVLIKGSRGMAMEDVAKPLILWANKTDKNEPS